MGGGQNTFVYREMCQSKFQSPRLNYFCEVEGRVSLGGSDGYLGKRLAEDRGISES